MKTIALEDICTDFLITFLFQNKKRFIQNETLPEFFELNRDGIRFLVEEYFEQYDETN